MSRESSDSDGLADWALVSDEGNIESEGAGSSRASSEEFVRVNRDGVVYNRSSSEEASLPESEAGQEMSELLTSSLEEVEGQELMDELWDLQSSAVSDPQGVSSLAGSMVSTGGESAELITDDEEHHIESSQALDLPSSIDISSSVSSLSLVPGLPQVDDLLDNADVSVSSDDGVISLSTDSLTCSKSETEERVDRQAVDDADKEAEVVGAHSKVESKVVLKEEVPGEVPAANKEAAAEADGGCTSDVPPEAQWLKYPIEKSTDMRHMIRLGDGRVIVAPPGADIESLAASLHLTDKSETSSETGSDSDFVRLEAASSSSSSIDNSDSEGEEGSRKSPALGEDGGAVEDVMSASVSSVSSQFRFIPQHSHDGEEHDENNDRDANEERQPSPAPLINNVLPLQAPQPLPQPQPLPPQQPLQPQEQVPAQAPLRPAAPLPVAPLPAAPEEDDNDGDTESVAGHSEDERTESEQSEAQGRQVEEDDQWSDDIGDIPLVRGDRQYVHRQNKRLNWTLDVVVAMNVLLVIGIGIGHFIGSMHEQYMNTEVQQAQQNQLSLLQDDLLQCHQKTDELLLRSEQLLKSELDQRQEVVGALSTSNSELRDQLQAQETELDTKREALGQCVQREKELQQVGMDLRNEINQLRHENAELTSRIAAMQYKTVLPEHATKSEDNKNLIEKLTKEADQLKNENRDLKEEIARLKLLLSDHTTDDVVVEEEDDGYESLDEVSEVTSSTFCPKTVEGQGKVMDLKAKINLLEQENAEMRAEIGRLRYKSHPSNSQVKRNRETVDVWEEDDIITSEEDPGVSSDGQAENFDKLKAELDAAKRQAENWEHLYMNLKERERGSKGHNSSVDFFTCMSIFTKKLNSSINATGIKDFLNVTRLLLSVEDVKDAFVHEFQNIWHEFSGSSNKGPKDKTKKEGPHAQKKWSDSVKDIINKTQSSMSDVSKQIKNTWNQVKNLSEELWKKHESSLSNVANKITERVKSFGDHLHTRIHQKANKWFRKNRKHWQDEHHQGPEYSREKQQRKHDGSFGRKHETKEKIWKTDQEKKEEKQKEKLMKEEQKKQEKLKKKVWKHFSEMKKLMSEMNDAKHMTMTEKDVRDVTDFFTRFQAEWDVFRLLKFSDAMWTTCQSVWWNNRLKNENPALSLKCFDAIYTWQLDWTSGKRNFKGMPGKGYPLGKKLQSKVFEKNHAEGKPYSYEEDKLRDSENATEWYEHRVKEGEEGRKEKAKEYEKKDRDWYGSLMKNRDELREEERKADWLFDRAVKRKESRASVFSESDSDSRSDWMYIRAEDRSYHHSQPDSWYFRRSEDREHKRDKGHGSYQQFDDDDDDVVVDDDVDYSYKDKYMFFDEE